MRNTTTTTVTQNNETLTVAFETFHSVIRAVITNTTDRKTFAYGENCETAKNNAVANYERKYNSTFFTL